MVLDWEGSDVLRLLSYLPFVMLYPFFFFAKLDVPCLGHLPIYCESSGVLSPKICPVSESMPRLDASGWGDLNSFSVTGCSLAISPALSFNSLTSELDSVSVRRLFSLIAKGV